MAGLFESAKARAKEAATAVLCEAGGIQRAVNDFNGKVNPFYTGSRGEAVTRGIERALTSFCPVPPPKNQPPPPPPFTGGQCAVAYRVRVNYTTGGTSQSSSVLTLLGPIQGTEIEDLPTEWVIRVRHSGGADVTQVSRITKFPGAVTPTATLIIERRIDNLPDDCGNLPPSGPSIPYPPTNPRPTLPDIDVDFPGLPSITIPLIPVVGIVNVNAEGKITVPVTVNATFDLGGQSFDVDLNFDIDLSDPTAEPTVPPTDPPLDPDDRPAPPDCPPPPSCSPGDEEDEEPDEPPIDPEDPEDEKEQEIKSVRVMSIVDPGVSPATEILMSGGAPNIHAPRIGSVKFVYAIVPGTVAWSTDIDVKATNQIIPAPKTGLRCLGAVFSPGRGVAGETFFTRGRRCDCD